MAVQRWGSLCLVVLLLASSFSISDTSVIPTEDDTYSKSSMEEVMEIPSNGTTQVCVVPLNSTSRLKILHTGTEGETQEVVVKRKSLTEHKLHILEIEVQSSNDSKPGLSVRLNGTQLPPLMESPSPTSPVPQQPRTALLFRGYARIALCTAAPKAREGEMPRNEVQLVTHEQEGEEVTTLSASSEPSFPTDASFSSTSEETESVEEDPWWSFLLVLGKVGEVPVLVLLLGGVLLGALFGGVVVCFCSKVCKKRRVEYQAVPTTRSLSLAKNDFIRDPRGWDTAGDRSSGIGSAISTLTNDNGSHMGNDNSIDRYRRSTTQLSVNNLSRGTTGSPSGSTGRGNNSSNNNTLNIPNSSSMPRYGSQKSTGYSENRDTESSLMLPHGSGRARTSSNRSTSSSINRNTNRSPNIPYTKTLGTLTGQHDPSVIPKNNDAHSDDWDSDDPNYEKPYVSSPIVAENYSVPHSTEIVMLERPTNTIALDTNKPADRQVPPSQYATFVLRSTGTSGMKSVQQ